MISLLVRHCWNTVASRCRFIQKEANCVENNYLPFLLRCSLLLASRLDSVKGSSEKEEEVTTDEQKYNGWRGSAAQAVKQKSNIHESPPSPPRTHMLTLTSCSSITRSEWYSLFFFFFNAKALKHMGGKKKFLLHFKVNLSLWAQIPSVMHTLKLCSYIWS